MAKTKEGPAPALGVILKRVRERRGLSVQALAKKSGMDAAHIQRLESGARSTPRFETVARLADALDVSLDEIAIETGLRNKKVGKGTSSVGMLAIQAEIRDLLGRLREAEAIAADLARRSGVPKK